MDRNGAALKAGLGYAVAAACLAWAFHDVKLDPLWKDVGRIGWSWMALAVVFDVLSYVCQGARWALLLRRRPDLHAADDAGGLCRTIRQRNAAAPGG